MPTYTIPDLYVEYTEKRNLNLTYEQFSVFAMFYPALLIANTDGEVDEKEWGLLQSLANSLVSLSVRDNASSEEIVDWQELFFSEFQYLIGNFDAWERKFIKSLKQHLNEKPQEKEAVLRVIYLLADASGGICEKESVMIEHLSRELGIETCKI